jgi:hypothetical protein
MGWLTSKAHARVALSALWLSGAAAAAPSAFGPGEQSTYNIEYLGLRAGTAQITVGAETQQWGQPVWPIVALARTDSVFSVYPVKDKFISYWSSGSQRCIGSELVADENNTRRRQRVRFDHQSKMATVTKQKEGESAKESKHDITEGSSDIAAATFSLRNHPLEVGRQFDVPVFTGSKSFTLRATVVEKQKLKTPLGEKDVLKVRAQTAFSGNFESKRDMFVYFTDDEAKIPLRVEADFIVGTVTAELVDYKPGKAMASLLPAK